MKLYQKKKKKKNWVNLVEDWNIWTHIYIIFILNIKYVSLINNYWIIRLNCEINQISLFKIENNWCNCWMKVRANLRNDHEFIINEYYLDWCEALPRSPKQNHKRLCSKWTISYHCGESCSSNMISEPCPVDNIILLWRVVFIWHGIRAMPCGQYHTICGELCSSNMISESCSINNIIPL